jgi:hypothetical protein
MAGRMTEASRNVLVFVMPFFWKLELWGSAGAFKISKFVWMSDENLGVTRIGGN